MTHASVFTNEDFFQQAVKTPADTNEHLPKLRELARKSHYVTEFGSWTGTSALGLLMGLIDRGQGEFLQVDINQDYLNDAGKRLDKLDLPEGVTRKALCASTLDVEIPVTNLLFIDTLHTYSQLKAELERHHGKVTHWIVLHDTSTFGYVGENAQAPALIAAVEEFITLHPEWRIVYQVDFNNGLTVLERALD